MSDNIIRAAAKAITAHMWGWDIISSSSSVSRLDLKGLCPMGDDLFDMGFGYAVAKGWIISDNNSSTPIDCWASGVELGFFPRQESHAS